MLKSRLAHLSAEEFANTITHGFGLMLSVFGFAVMLLLALIRSDLWLTIGSFVYGLSLVTLYAASTYYHGTNCPIRKKTLQIVDHCCIYLLIAGSYTPFGIVILNGTLGHILLILIWSFALAGVAMKVIFRDRFPAVSVISYLIMGWLGIFALQPLFAALGIEPVILAVVGGIAYSIGVIFFAWERIPHNHAIFHVFVLAGSLLHYLAIILYVVT